ncbi:hypothetical protein F5Y13DRAFT_202494 [Hypoxylon sp. FL1857]|nr:hypothetical protein F5Y13DRAFT_202494 [Hypoxylon sp. FL1857]
MFQYIAQQLMADKAQEPKPAPPPRDSQGWLWRCTADRDLLLENAIAQGYPVGYDLLGDEFAGSLTVRPRSPESRADKLSFFGEVTSAQLKTYTPDQVRKILEQRENILEVAARSSSSLPPPPGFDCFKTRKPWVPDEVDECQFKCCPRCRPSAETRSYPSLDGIVNGDIPPSAAVGFDFQRSGRIVIHPDRLKDIGLRAVPWPGAAAKSETSTSSVSSLSSLSSLHCSSLSNEEDSEAMHAESPESLSSGDSLATESIAADEHQLSVIPQPPWPHSPVSSKENIRAVLFSACLTSLPAPTPEEQASLCQSSTHAKEETKDEGFHEQPADVVYGVAILEESVKLGVPDIISQV